MRFKNKNDGYSFESKIKDNKIHISGYAGRKKISTSKVSITGYLKNESKYSRRQFLFNEDVHNVKTDSENIECSCVAERNLDFIQESIEYILKEEGLYEQTIGEIVEARSKAKIKASEPVEPAAPSPAPEHAKPVKPIKPVVKNFTEKITTETCEHPLIQKQATLIAFA